MAARLESPGAASQIALTLTQAIKDASAPPTLVALAQGLSAVTARLGPLEAARATAALTEAATQTSHPGVFRALAESLSALLSEVPPTTLLSRSVAVTSAVGCRSGTGGPLTALPYLAAAAEPLPCRLSTQLLIDLLKHPGAVGDGRRVVLDHLGNRYHRPFADVWEFVRFAREQKLDVDLTSPPRRTGERR